MKNAQTTAQDRMRIRGSLKHLIGQVTSAPGLIQISRDEYLKLLKLKLNYDILLRGLIDKGELGYGSSSELRWDDDDLNTLLELLEPDVYESRISKLKREKEAKKREVEG